MATLVFIQVWPITLDVIRANLYAACICVCANALLLLFHSMQPVMRQLLPLAPRAWWWEVSSGR